MTKRYSRLSKQAWMLKAFVIRYGKAKTDLFRLNRLCFWTSLLEVIENFYGSRVRRRSSLCGSVYVSLCTYFTLIFISLNMKAIRFNRQNQQQRFMLSPLYLTKIKSNYFSLRNLEILNLWWNLCPWPSCQSFPPYARENVPVWVPCLGWITTTKFRIFFSILSRFLAFTEFKFPRK